MSIDLIQHSWYNRASAHLEAIVHRLLEESTVRENVALWESTIISLVREVVSAVDPNVKEGDSIDIRNYVKLKVIPGMFRYLL